LSEHLVIVGPGRMGLAFGAALLHAGAADRIVFQGRSLEPPPHPIFDTARDAADRADRGDRGEPVVSYSAGLPAPPTGTTAVILAVPDTALAEVAYDLAAAGRSPEACSAFHLAGAIATDVLEPLHAAGYTVGSIHPLQSVADPWERPDALIGIAFGIAGEPVALATARRLVSSLQGAAIVVPPALRARYHAAAVLASNHVIALLAMASRMLSEVGISDDDALAALLPLVRTTVENVRHLGLPGALTGPVARGDVDTVRLHLARLSEEEGALYSGLGRELLRLARAAGLDPERANDLEDLFAQ
jgi:predicted short-subunit dehydrogenase-like oxidoreductase (DUF2520 family)